MDKKRYCGAAARNARRVILTLLALLAWGAAPWAQIPDAPTPPRLVNDLAGILRDDERAALERRLVAMDDSTSTQITVVTVADLGGQDIAQFAQELGEKWGVGRKGRDNGVVIVVKPKGPDGKGRAFIATGYGLEGALPDVLCSRIVREVMIPHFQGDDYAGGISAGVDAVIGATRGEFEAEAKGGQEAENVAVVAALAGLLALLLYVAGRAYISHYNKAKSRRERITTTMTFVFVVATIYTVILNLLMQFASAMGRSSSRGGSHSGGGGSFGGFGGGSFGGGGGGGSW